MYIIIILVSITGLLSVTTQGIVIVYDCTSLHSFNLLTKWIGYVGTVSICNNNVHSSTTKKCVISGFPILCRVHGFMACFVTAEPLFVTQHATADVSLMLLASKVDLDSKREVPTDDGLKVYTECFT